MAIILERPELFALATLMQAGPILGLDAAQFIPDSPADQQALYDKGRDLLLARDLLRWNNLNQIEIEQGLREIMQALIDPQNALMAVRITPGLGRQMFYYYERNGRYVEQILPDDHHHQLGVLDNENAVTERLLDIFPLPTTPANDERFTCSLKPLLRAFQLAGEMRRSDIPSAVEAAQPTDLSLANQFMSALINAEFLGNISLFKLIPERTTQSHDIAFVQSATGVWGVAATQTPEVTSVERIDGATLRATLLAGLSAMRQPA